MKQTVKSNPKGDIVVTRYEPNGLDHSFQQDITRLMHDIVQDSGITTLAEIGYLHMNTVMYNHRSGEYKFQVYFAYELAARETQSMANARVQTSPIRALTLFENYLYVGRLVDAVEYADVLVPKFDIVQDEFGRDSLQFKESKKLAETRCLILNCNIAIACAAALDTSLSDPNFSVKCETVGKVGHRLEDSVMITGSMDDVPVGITVYSSKDADGYDPEEAVPYLMRLNDINMRETDSHSRLVNEVRKKAKKASNANKPKEGKLGKMFNKFA